MKNSLWIFNSKREHIRIRNWEKHTHTHTQRERERERLALKTLNKQESKKTIWNLKKTMKNRRKREINQESDHLYSKLIGKVSWNHYSLIFLNLEMKGKAPICFVKIRIHVDWRKLLI